MADKLKPTQGRDITARGLHIPVHPARREADANFWEGVNDDVQAKNNNLMSDFRTRRSATTRISRAGGQGDVMAAIPRLYNPTDFWEMSNLPYDINKDEHRERMYKWLDLIYRTHDLLAILVDIFTRFPLVGMDLKSDDKRLDEFYKDHFFNHLDYEQFLVDLGREYWLFGQAYPCGSFDEDLGVWEREELLDPMAVTVERVPILGSTQFFLEPLPELVQILKTREPPQLYHELTTEYASMVPYLLKAEAMPISDVLLKQVAFKASPRDTYGTPLLLRGLRTLIHEEKLLQSQDAIAERLYAPLILAKLGIPDLGDNQGPWIPSPAELGYFRDDLDYALSSDFRLIVHHFGVEIQNVFGREQMPRLDQDFDRIDAKLMRIFGVNPSLLSGGTSVQPYASSALQAEFLNQILRTFQKYLKKHYRQRALIVAEAQEHYAYEKRGVGERVPIMERVVVTDEEGNQTVEEKKKLLVPDLEMKVLDLRDEATQREFMFQLKAAGVPIPDADLAVGFDFDFEASLDNFEEELIQKTVAQQEAKVQTYKVLMARGYPIPPELRAEIEGGGAPQGGGMPGGIDVNTPSPGEPILMPPPPGGGIGGPGVPPPATPNSPQRGQVPEQSHERNAVPPGGIPVGRPRRPGGPGGPGGAGSPGGVFTSVEEDPESTVFERPASREKRDLAKVKKGLNGSDSSD